MKCYLPNRRVPIVSYQDRDNFITNQVTILGEGDGDGAEGSDHVPIPPSGSAAGLPPVLTLQQVKIHLRIELEETAEDAYLVGLEMAARLHTENVLRLPLDPEVGENIKQAMLLLIAHWYRNRESVGDDKLAALPQAYEALLGPERDYPHY